MQALLAVACAPCANVERYEPLLVVVSVLTAMLEPTHPKPVLPSVHSVPLVPPKVAAGPAAVQIALQASTQHREAPTARYVLLARILQQTLILARLALLVNSAVLRNLLDVCYALRGRSRTLKLQYVPTVMLGSISPPLDNSSVFLPIPDSKCLPPASRPKTSVPLASIRAQPGLVRAPAAPLVPMLRWLAAPTASLALSDSTKIKLEKLSVLPVQTERARAVWVPLHVKCV